MKNPFACEPTAEQRLVAARPVACCSICFLAAKPECYLRGAAVSWCSRFGALCVVALLLMAGSLLPIIAQEGTNAAPATPGGVVKWKFKTGGSVHAAPLVVGGVVFFGSYDQTFYAVETATGRELWRFKTGGRILSTPALAGGTVFFGSQDNRCYALDAATGKLKWKF
ncbi:MAG: PQQ-like beta-propeller repeat protein, partial [Acidobacteriota bacterium]|nr:PQQ-like beta-propeller repeat protein [Acidobacteriota bacterium]